MPEHFVAAPHWGWYIVGYFFLGGIAGGAYALGVMLHLWGEERDREAARVAFRICFPLLVVCAILLTLDLGKPTRFWHMLIDSRTFKIAFKYWSPMSVGAWALLLFGAFAAVSFLGARAPGGGVARFLSGALGRVFQIVGALLGLVIAGYTGVLLSVSNQPVWSDTWTLGGLFLASGLSAAAAAIALVALRYRPEAGASVPKLSDADRYFIILELALLVLFFWTLGGMASKALGAWILLWLVVLAGTVIPLVLHLRPALGRQRSPLLAPGLVLLCSLALRTVILFSAQT
jgi:formate-dependent nitrite reductase membrane component NrfD